MPERRRTARVRGRRAPSAVALVQAREPRSETEFERMVEDAADYLGWTHYHTHDSRRSDPGFPDLVLVKGPRQVFVELKVKNRQPTADQRRWLAVLKAVPGNEVYLFWPKDWAALTIMLGALPA